MQILTSPTIRGTPFSIGEALGRMGKPAIRRLPDCADWNLLQKWRGHSMVSRLMERTREIFPDYWDELRGMSVGLGMEFDDIFLWNCRADLLSTTNAVSSSIGINRLGSALVVHKVQDDPAFKDCCRLVEVKPEGKPGFLSLYVPGCVPGHVFAANHAGVVQVVNNLEGGETGTGIPSAIISRAVLDACSLLEAIDTVMQCDRSGSTHHMLASTQEFIMVGIEATPSNRSLVPIPNKYGHTNHALRKDCISERTHATRSSRERYVFLEKLIKEMPAHPIEEDVMRLLDPRRDARGGGPAGTSSLLPEENDIGTAFFRVEPNRVHLRLFQPGQLESQNHIINVA